MVKVLRSPGESFAFLDKAGNVVAIIGIHDFVYGKLNKLAARINVSVNEWFQVSRTENVEKQKIEKFLMENMEKEHFIKSVRFGHLLEEKEEIKK